MAKKKSKAQIEREIAAIMRAGSGPSARDAYLASLPSSRIPLQLPWENSYSNWCTHLGRAAGDHNARIDYGSETYDAWQAGVAPDDYAKARANTTRGPGRR
jgi:hypothetical protein